MAGGGGRAGENGSLAEQQAKLREMEELMSQQDLDLGAKKSVKFGGEDCKVLAAASLLPMPSFHPSFCPVNLNTQKETGTPPIPATKMISTTK